VDEFVVEHESLLMDDKPDYDVFNFDDLGFVTSLLMSFLLVMLLLFHLI